MNMSYLFKLLNKYTGKFKIEIGTIIKDEKRDITIIDRKIRKDKKAKAEILANRSLEALNGVLNTL